MDRRTALGISITGTVGLLAAARAAETGKPPVRPELLVFDVNETLLDLAPLKKSVAAALGGKPELVKLWFTTLLQYSLVETVSGGYRPFGEIGAATLVMVAANEGISLTLEEAREAVAPIVSLPPHPEVKSALAALKEAGFRMITLTNSSQEGVDAQIKHAGLEEFFERRLSVSETRKFKPHQETYQWAAGQMKVPPGNCMLIAAHGWDIAGAVRAGWRGLFLARPGAQLYPLVEAPERSFAELKAAADYLIALPADR